MVSQDPVADWVVATRLLKSADFLPQLTTQVSPTERHYSAKLSFDSELSNEYCL